LRKLLPATPLPWAPMKTLLITFTLLLLATAAAAQVQPLSAWWTDTGETDSTWLGLSLANLGDVNGDGYADFCTGSQQNTIYVYYGSAEPDSNYVYTFGPPGDTTDNFSYFMHNVGDVNGDGDGDLLIYSGTWDRNVHYYCYLYFGGTAFDTIPDMVFDGGEQFESDFGSYAGAVGDFNGDGGNDFIIGDGGYPIQPYPNLIVGKYYLYFGGNLLDSIPDLTMTGNEQFDRFYGEIAELGDINSNGYDDFLLGDASCSVPNGLGCGAVILFSGGSFPNLTPDWFQYGDTVLAQFGLSVAGIDFNHDGEKDLIVGNGEEYQPNRWGAIYVYWGGEEISNLPNKLLISQFGEGVGYGLMGCDLNGDGYEDVVSCCPGLNWGKTFVWLGGQYADTLYDCSIERSGYENRFGQSHISCDVNGDGVDDLILGEPGYHYTGLLGATGRIHVVLGDTVFHQSVGVKHENHAIPLNPNLSLKSYPNPFNSSINLELNWQGTEIPRLEIYDLSGKKIITINLKFNQKEVTWDGTTDVGINCNSGIYFVKLSTKTQRVSKKIALIK
jgi:hypothetical protein